MSAQRYFSLGDETELPMHHVWCLDLRAPPLHHRTRCYALPQAMLRDGWTWSPDSSAFASQEQELGMGWCIVRPDSGPAESFEHLGRDQIEEVEWAPFSRGYGHALIARTAGQLMVIDSMQALPDFSPRCLAVGPGASSLVCGPSAYGPAICAWQGTAVQHA